jgi:hypothetical protein
LLEELPKNGDVPKSPLPLIGSPGAIGRHDFDLENRRWLRIVGAVGTHNLHVRALSARLPIFQITKGDPK